MLKPNKKKLILAGKITFTLIALYFASLKISFLDIKIILTNLNWFWVSNAFLLLVISKLISAFRCNFFFQAIGVQLSTIENIRLCFIGLFYNTLLPGSIGGDAYKIYYLNSLKLQTVKKLTLSILLDRISGIWAIGLLIILSCLVYNIKFPIPFFFELLWIGLILWYPIKYILLKILSISFTSVALQVSIISILVQVTQVLCCLCILKSMNVTTDLALHSVLFLISSIASVIPISIAGLGLREASFIFFHDLLNLTLDLKSGIGMMVIFFILNLLSSVPGGFITMNSKTNEKIKSEASVV